ncbi:MAG TPA: MATE family efflux transporter [Natronosporangium sp.]
MTAAQPAGTARQIVGLALPILATSLVDIVMSTVDTAVIGRLGAVSLAGAALVAGVYLACSQVMAGFAVGFQILVARRLGGDDRAGAAALLRPLLLWGMALAASIAALVTGSAYWLVRLFAVAEPVAVEATAYLQVRVWSLVPFVVVLLARMFLQCDRKPGLGLRIIVLAQAVNAALTPALAFGWLGPRLGIRGVAIASVLAMAVAAYLLLRKVRQLLPELALPVRSRSGLADALRLGVPEGINAALDYAGNLVFVGLIAVIGTAALAAGQLAIVVVMILFVVCMSFAVAVQILMSRRLGGGGDANELRQFYRQSQRFLVLIGLTLAVTSPAWARGVAYLLSDEPVVRAAAYRPLIVVGVAVVFMMLATHATAGLRALQRTREVMTINVAAVWLVQLPLAFAAVRAGGSHALAWVMGAYVGYFAVRAAVGDLLVRRRLGLMVAPAT